MAHIYAFVVLCATFVAAPATLAGEMRIAAASSLKYVLDDLMSAFRLTHAGDTVTAIYASSGKMASQIIEGAPYDLFLSADLEHPSELVNSGSAVPPVRTYAVGRLVLWSLKGDIKLTDLVKPTVRRLAIANYRTAPYGQRAREVLENMAVWSEVAGKLAIGESIAHVAQYVDSGAADAGIVSLSLVLSPPLAGRGHWTLIDESLHSPIQHGLVVTSRAADNALVAAFVDYLAGAEADAIFQKYGLSTQIATESGMP